MAGLKDKRGFIDKERLDLSERQAVEYWMKRPLRKRKRPPPQVPIQRSWFASSARLHTQEFSNQSFSL